MLPALGSRVLRYFLNAAERFTVLGATVEETSIPIHSLGGVIWTGVSKVGVSHKDLRFTRKKTVPDVRAQSIGPSHEQEKWDCAYVSTMNVYLNGAYAVKEFPGLLAKSNNPACKLRDDYDAALAKYDLSLTPTLPLLAASHAALMQCRKSRSGSR